VGIGGMETKVGREKGTLKECVIFRGYTPFLPLLGVKQYNSNH
jgi:hypothetical protein